MSQILRKRIYIGKKITKQIVRQVLAWENIIYIGGKNMAWYYRTYACGHEGRENVTGKTEERMYRVEKLFSGLCPECRKRQQEEEHAQVNAQAEIKSLEHSFPQLSGSEKQVAWANTIRMKFYEDCISRQDNPDKIINIETDAKFWIDNRNNLCQDFIDKYIEKKQEELQHKTAVENSTVEPAEKKHDGVVEISEYNSYGVYKVILKYKKNDDFKNIVKAHGYVWDDGEWIKKLTRFTGAYKDRAAEIGNILLKNGFSISITDEKIRDMAVNGSYKEEVTRWITEGAEPFHVYIRLTGNDAVYKKAMSITDAKYSNSKVEVTGSHYREIRKFAEENSFKFTGEADRILQKYEEKDKKKEQANT
jgi:hypothetical protein